MKKLLKLFLFTVVLYIFIKGGIFLYLKSTPKLEIGSANNVYYMIKRTIYFFREMKVKHGLV